jgi:putative oxidoreductase
MNASMTTTEPPLPQRAVRAYGTIAGLIDRLQPLFALALRLYVGRVFFVSGMIKLSNWDSTLALFAHEYHVPVLPPHLAAILGTAAEVGLPVLLVLGLGTRFTAIAMFVFNIVAATSYPDLSPAGLKDHILWGALLLVTFFYGPGKIALDTWLEHQYQTD